MDIDDIIFPFNYTFPPNLMPDKTGLIALGGKLTTLTLIEAYSKGIFPWAGTDPIPWYSPDPRLILIPEEFHLSKSLNKLLNKNDYTVLYDFDFKTVITNCSKIRRKQQHGTWIDNTIINAYTKLFDLNIAHCIEVYLNNELQGGLYGISLGYTFFGESMFSVKSNGSKIALYYLAQKLISLGISLIDCQQSTPHMISLGAKEILRESFLKMIRKHLKDGIKRMKWHT